MQYPIVGSFNGVASALFPDHVSDEIFMSWMPNTTFQQWTGGIDKPIYRRQVKTGEGVAFECPRLYALDWQNPSIDGQQKEGLEQVQRVESMMVTLKQITWAVKNRDLELMRVGTPVATKLQSDAVIQIKEASAKYYDDSVIKAGTNDVYKPTGAFANGGMPITARAVAGDNAAILYAYAGGATLPATIDALMGAALDYTTKASVANIKACTDKALASLAEDAIKPYNMTMLQGQLNPTYVMLMSSVAIRQLENDPAFTAAYTTRGLALQDQPSPVNGAFFVGKVDATLVFRCPQLDRYTFTINGHTYSWNLMFGTGAWSVGWGLFPKIVKIENMAELKSAVYSHEMRGLQSLRFPSLSQPGLFAEQGIIHSFTRNS